MKKSFLNALMTGLLGAIIIGTTVSVYTLLCVERTALQQQAFGFVVLAEVLAVVGVSLMFFLPGKANKTFANAGAGSVLFLYVVVTVAASLFSGYVKEFPALFLVVQIVILSVSLYLYIAILYLGFSVGAKDAATKSGQAGMLMCERRLHALVVDADRKSYRAALEKLHEKARFANPREIPECDTAIQKQLDDLERLAGAGGENENVLASINTLDNLFRKRAHAQLQKGGF